MKRLSLLLLLVVGSCEPAWASAEMPGILEVLGGIFLVIVFIVTMMGLFELVCWSFRVNDEIKTLKQIRERLAKLEDFNEAWSDAEKSK